MASTNTHMARGRRCVTVEISLGVDTVVVEVPEAIDLDQPFWGYCIETGERLRFANPWACDIEVTP
jgi:hypothetical protein